MLTFSPSQSACTSPSQPFHCHQFNSGSHPPSQHHSAQSPPPHSLWRTQPGSPELVSSSIAATTSSTPDRRFADASTQNSPVAPSYVAISRLDAGYLLRDADVKVSTPPSKEAPTSSTAKSQSSANRQTSRHEIAPATSSADGQHAYSKLITSTQVAVKTLPAEYESCNVEDLVTLISSMISELIEMNDQLPLSGSSLTRFHSRFAR